MSLTANLIFNREQDLIPQGGKATHYRPEDYIDAKRPKQKAAKEAKATCSDHMINKKVENSEAIMDALRLGHKTQRAITKATGLCKGSVSNHLKRLVGSKDVDIDDTKNPWTYQIAKDKQ